MPKVLAIKTGHHTFTVKEPFEDDVNYIGLTEEVELTITKQRHKGRHDKYFIMIDTLLTIERIQQEYQNKKEVHDMVKVEAGYCHIRQMNIHGEKYLIKTPKSIKFNAMDDIKFREFYDKAVNAVIQQILPEYVPIEQLHNWQDHFARNF